MDSSVSSSLQLSLRQLMDRLHLAHHILRDRSLIHQSGVLAPILELGAGTGFLSILLAQLGADVVASDLGNTDDDEDVEGERRTPLARLQANVELSESQYLSPHSR